MHLDLRTLPETANRVRRMFGQSYGREPDPLTLPRPIAAALSCFHVVTGPAGNLQGNTRVRDVYLSAYDCFDPAPDASI